jgi:hypothetical protein
MAVSERAIGSALAWPTPLACLYSLAMERTSVPRLVNGGTARHGTLFHHTVLSSDTAATLCRSPLTRYVGLLSLAGRWYSGISPPRSR